MAIDRDVSSSRIEESMLMYQSYLEPLQNQSNHFNANNGVIIPLSELPEQLTIDLANFEEDNNDC